MKIILPIVALLFALGLSACATKSYPHKLESSASGDNAAPTTSSW